MGSLADRIALGRKAWAEQGKRNVETRVVRVRGRLTEQHRIDGGQWFTPKD